MVDPSALIEEIRSARTYEGQIAHVRTTSRRRARYGELDRPLHSVVQGLLTELGIKRLFSHQTEAVSRALKGENVAVVASTSSGKTLCYTIPIAERIYERPTSRAFLVFPTKALAQDQLRKLGAFGAGTAFTAACYDGDTPQQHRREIKREAQVVLTNPDMLHIGILPYHHTWADFFRRLQFVVLDEVHVYRGVFGSHTANVIRRLRRIAAHYGARPQFITCSATIGNPQELCEKLTGLPAALVDDDGSPGTRRTWVFWNPPLRERGEGRRSANMESAALLAGLVRSGVRTIDFTLARKVAELVVQHTQRDLGGARSKLGKLVMAYRGGYLPEERREIEQHLFAGELLGVVSTSALELGVDIGHLEAVIMTGYPGSIASTMQQAGRAGRLGGAEETLAFLVAEDNAVDQFLIAQPEYLFSTASERALVDPRNRFILAAHLLCAAFELPIAPAEYDLFGPDTEALLQVLAECPERFLTRRTNWYWIGAGYPAGQVSIRSASGQSYDIVEDGKTPRLIGTVDGQSAFVMVHEGAIYLHRGESYMVERLDVEQHVAYVRRTDEAYYTDALSASQVWVVEEQQQAPWGQSGTKHLGEVRVVTRVTGYVKRQIQSGATIESAELELPAQEYETIGLWVPVPEDDWAALQREGRDLAGSLHALEHALVALVPLFAACDVRDVAGVSHTEHPDLGRPALFIYDGAPGGVGIAEAAFDRWEELVRAAAQVVGTCPCEHGCPSCVQSPNCASMNHPLDKAGALFLAQRWAVGSRQ